MLSSVDAKVVFANEEATKLSIIFQSRCVKNGLLECKRRCFLSHAPNTKKVCTR
jgi:hypothetical protein